MTVLTRTHRMRLAGALGLAALAASAAAAPATAAAPASLGATTIALDGPLAQQLRDAHVAIAATASARGGGARLVLPVAAGKLARAQASLTLDGRVTLSSGSRVRRTLRTLALTRWRLRVEDGRARVSALSGSRRRTLLAADVPARRLALDTTRGSVRVEPVQLRLTRVGARLVRTRLQLERLPAGVLGSLRLAATVPGTAGGGAGGSGGGAVGGGGTGGGGGGGGGGGTTPPPGCTPGYSSGAIPPAPAPLARPAGALDVTAATLTWRPRESFVQYIASGEGTSASDGATAGPPETVPGNSARLVYSFGFELKPGSWYDPAGGSADLLGRGTVRFLWRGHGIDIKLRDPEVELNGGASRAIFTFSGSDCTQIAPVRGIMLDLAPAAPTVNGSTRDYGAIPARITDAGASMFSGFYLPGDPWGSFAAAFTAGP